MHSVLQISRVVIVKSMDTRSPTMVTVAYKGWWQTPKVHLRLTLDLVPKYARQLRGEGKCELQQRFSRGRGPMLRVKGPTKKLVVRLYKGGNLKTQAEITLGDLLSRTAEGVTQIPFKLEEGGKIEKAFVEMEQISPNPTPLPPPLLPITFKFLSRDISPGETVFPPAQEPTPFRLMQLVGDMYGPVTDKTDWSKPFTLGLESLAEDDASHEGPQSLHTDTCNTDTGSSSDQDTDTDTSLMDEDQSSDKSTSKYPEAESTTVLVQPLPLPRLNIADRSDILGRRWLSDDVMDLAQEILQRQFPETRGLYACGAAFTLPPLQPGDMSLFLQVVNRSAPLHLDSMADYGRLAGTHWLLLSSYGAKPSGQLTVYDSMYNNLSACTTALVAQLQELHVPPPGAIMRRVQRQNDGYSCGLFALAFAFSIAVGQDPCTVCYDRASMAPHLVKCLEQGVVQPFPSVPAGRGR
ncbi:hypothetical protein E2C01_067540 [Portunus trituberculatus]|uniref:Ubiquitin-like protease family profile domain-containing protein n=1 Tax=Portunus trituberculatus TaxID=210409 RepID=A0A5B7HWZ9_PORTR|nr:hypothetical protein [Portunus trituberculatus]